MPDIELRHLAVLRQIHRTQSVTKAAAQLGMSQPGISIVLAQLRRRLNDPLFVRTSAGMQPTPRLEAMMAPIEQALGLVDAAFGQQQAFEPASSARVFRICMAELGNLSVLPRLLAHLRAQAPGVGIEVMQFSAETWRLLEAGEADLAIGVPARMQAGFYQQRLFTESFVCMARRGHPRIGDTLTAQAFFAEAHVAVSSTSSQWLIARTIDTRRAKRRIALTVTSFLGLPELIAQSDLLATVPSRVARQARPGRAVRLLPLPMDSPTYTVRQYWHKRFQHDPQGRWLRALVARLFTD